MIRCRGFTKGNTDLDEAKRAIDKGWQNKSLAQNEIDAWVNQGGFLGWRIPKGFVVVDIDNKKYATTIIAHMESIGKCGVYKTPKGVHLIYKTGASVKNTSNIRTTCGLEVDYRVGGKGYIIYPTWNSPDRKILREIPEDVETMPSFFNPIKDLESPLCAKQGSRNQTLYNWYCKLLGLEVPEADRVIFFTNMLLDDPLEEEELTKSINSANNWWAKQGEKFTMWDKDHIKVTKYGTYPLLSVSNLTTLLNMYNINVRVNEMTHELELNGEFFKNEDDITVKDLTQKHKFVGASTTNISNYISCVGLNNSYHPVEKYLTDLKPINSTQEFNKLCSMLIHSMDKDFVNMLLKRWLISAICAIYRPDFASQGVLTLQGEGGIMKSTWLKKLCPIPKAFQGEVVGFDACNKDQVAKVTGTWITELAELDSTMKKDYIALKGFITNPEDVYRAAYDRRLSRHKRKTIFCASVNGLEFLKDDSNRRFWVISLDKIDMGIKIDLNTLWSEIKYMYENGERHYLTNEETTELNNINREYTVKTVADGYIQNLLDYENGVITEVTATELMKWVTDGKTSPTAIGISLKKLGFNSFKKKRNGRDTRVYKLPIKSEFKIT